MVHSATLTATLSVDYFIVASIHVNSWRLVGESVRIETKDLVLIVCVKSGEECELFGLVERPKGVISRP
jgi:hypothetical protein